MNSIESVKKNNTSAQDFINSLTDFSCNLPKTETSHTADSWYNLGPVKSFTGNDEEKKLILGVQNKTYDVINTDSKLSISQVLKEFNDFISFISPVQDKYYFMYILICTNLEEKIDVWISNFNKIGQADLKFKNIPKVCKEEYVVIETTGDWDNFTEYSCIKEKLSRLKNAKLVILSSGYSRKIMAIDDKPKVNLSELLNIL
jgi:hypothetical protein